MKRVALLTLCSIFFTSCEKREKSEVVDASILIQESKITESSLKNARVVAYRFALPGEGGELPMELGFSLITRERKLDLAALKNLKQAEATLTAEQVSRLVDAIYGTHDHTGPAACYDPHHIFLFYDTTDVLINVVEVCFGCTNLHAQPQIEESQWGNHDFRGLARICDEIRIGMSSGTAEDQIRLWDERDQILDGNERGE